MLMWLIIFAQTVPNGDVWIMTPREWVFASALILVLGMGSKGVWNWGRELAEKTAELAREREGRKADRVWYESEIERAREEVSKAQAERDRYADLFVQMATTTQEVLPRIDRKLQGGGNGRQEHQP